MRSLKPKAEEHGDSALLNLTVNVHVCPDSGTQRKTQLDRIEEGIQKIMATQEAFAAVLARIDAATNKIAADLQALAEQVTNAGLSAEVEAQVLESLTGAAAKLEGIGKPVTPPVEG